LKNIVEPSKPKMTIWRMRISYWITKATDTHSEYVILIVSPRQQHLRKHSLMLRSYARCMYGSWTLLEIRTLKYIHCKENREEDDNFCVFSYILLIVTRMNKALYVNHFFPNCRNLIIIFFRSTLSLIARLLVEQQFRTGVLLNANCQSHYCSCLST